MKLVLFRDSFGPTFTLGTLSIDERHECYTVEDSDRRLEDGGTKVPGRTAIPRGTYRVQLTRSPKYGRVMPLIVGVPGFEGVRIHSGNTSEDTEGCIIVGDRSTGDMQAGRVSDSRITYRKLFEKLIAADQRNEEITIEVM
jgi:hypothetical protein